MAISRVTPDEAYGSQKWKRVSATEVYGEEATGASPSGVPLLSAENPTGVGRRGIPLISAQDAPRERPTWTQRAMQTGRQLAAEALPALGGVVGGAAGTTVAALEPTPFGELFMPAYGAAQGMATGQAAKEYLFPEYRPRSALEATERRSGEIGFGTAAGLVRLPSGATIKRVLGGAGIGAGIGAVAAPSAKEGEPSNMQAYMVGGALAGAAGGVALRPIGRGVARVSEKVARSAFATQGERAAEAERIAAAQRGEKSTEIPLTAGERGSRAGKVFEIAEEAYMPTETAKRRVMAGQAAKSEIEKILPDEPVSYGNKFNRAWQEADRNIAEEYNRMFGETRKHVTGNTEAAKADLSHGLTNVMERTGGLRRTTIGGGVDKAQIAPQVTDVVTPASRIPGDPVSRAHQFVDALRTGNLDLIDKEFGIAIPEMATPGDIYGDINRIRQALGRRLASESDEQARAIYRLAYGEARRVQKGMLSDEGKSLFERANRDFEAYAKQYERARIFNDEGLPEPTKVSDMLNSPDRLAAAHEILTKGKRVDAAQNIGNALLREEIAGMMAGNKRNIYTTMQERLKRLGDTPARSAAFNQRATQEALDIAAYWDIINDIPDGGARQLLRSMVIYGAKLGRFAGMGELTAGARSVFTPGDIGAATTQAAQWLSRANISTPMKERLMRLTGGMATELIRRNQLGEQPRARGQAAAGTYAYGQE